MTSASGTSRAVFGANESEAVAALAAGIAEGFHTGAQAYLSVRGQVLLDCAIGTAAGAEPMRTDSAQIWTSSGKPVVAVTFARLWERGILGLDDPVRRYVPALTCDVDERVTVRRLLTHTAPFPEDVAQLSAVIGTEATLQRLNDGAIDPVWAYDGEDDRPSYRYLGFTNWFLLGLTLEGATGHPLPELVQREVLDPVGMDDCFFVPTQRGEGAAERLVPMFQQTDDGRLVEFAFGLAARQVPVAGVGLHGPIAQLGRFYEALLAAVAPRPASSAADAGLIRPTTAAALIADHAFGLRTDGGDAAPPQGLGVKLGGSFRPLGTRRAFGHTGIRSSFAFADPQTGVVAAVCPNGMVQVNHDRRRRRAILDGLAADIARYETTD